LGTIRPYQLGAAINASLDAIFVLTTVRDARGRILDFRVADVNVRALRLMGATRAMLVDRSVSELLPAIRTNGFFDDYVRVVETGQPEERVVLMGPPWRHAKWPGAKYVHRQVIRLGDGVLVTARDVTKQKEAELALRALPRHISRAQDAERQRVARELHDGVSQLLVSARFRLDEAFRILAQANGAQKHVERARHTIAEAIHEVRRISHALRPRALDEFGLLAALGALLTEFEERTGIGVRYRKPLSGRALAPVVAENLYRIAQESLTNIERHASARHVWVTLRASARQITMTMEDDGRGISPNQINRSSGLGLLHMRERAESLDGTLIVGKRARGGTLITVQIPLARGKKGTKTHG
jgi:signal transduction histidine kinase